jgi:predicted GIY-YIG superfamily endonuclease
MQRAHTGYTNDEQRRLAQYSVGLGDGFILINTLIFN